MTDTTEVSYLEKDASTISQLRSEVYNLKQCYTSFAFQGIAFASVVLVAILGFQDEYPLIGVASIPVIISLLLVVRVGIHKIEGANRLAGYELHLERRRRIPANEASWSDDMRDIGLEEAFYVWRIVQPSIYHRMYDKPKEWWNFWTATKLRNDVSKRNILLGSNTAFERELKKIDKGIKFSPGSYLAKTHHVLHIICFLALFPILVTVIQSYRLWGFDPISAASALILAIMLWVIWKRLNRVSAKRRILESELLSINSCAILWHAIVVAHGRALRRTKDSRFLSYDGYTENIINEAETIVDNYNNIYKYIEGRHISPAVGSRSEP